MNKTKHKIDRIFVNFIAILNCCLILNCAKALNGTIKNDIQAGTMRTETSNVLIGPGDELEIKFYLTPDINEIQRVRPDGNITMQLLGDVNVAGKTPGQIENELMGLYSSQLKNQRISVLVRSLYSRRIYVGGEVNTPGLVEFYGRMTALEAIIESGGYNTETARLDKVIVNRMEDGKRIGYQVDLKPFTKGQAYEPFFLQPYDIIYVPRTRIASLNFWIDQHVDNLIPQFIFGTFGVWVLREFIFYEE